MMHIGDVIAFEQHRRALIEKAQEAARVSERLQHVSYASYLSLPVWCAMRRSVLARARDHCERCRHATERLVVHHVRYRERGKERLDDLLVMCTDCHAQIHAVLSKSHVRVGDAVSLWRKRHVRGTVCIVDVMAQTATVRWSANRIKTHPLRMLLRWTRGGAHATSG